MFFSNTRWTQLLAPLEILMSKISLKYIPINIHNVEHSRVIMNMKLSSHGFLFHINRRENKAHIPLIIHHNKKKHVFIYIYNRRVKFKYNSNWSYSEIFTKVLIIIRKEWSSVYQKKR